MSLIFIYSCYSLFFSKFKFKFIEVCVEYFLDSLNFINLIYYFSWIGEQWNFGKKFLKNQMKLKGKWDAWEKAIVHMCDWINESKLGQKSCNWEFSQRRCFLICSLTLLISTLFLCSKFQTKSSHKQFLFLIIFTTWSNYELNIQNAMMEIFILFFFSMHLSAPASIGWCLIIG